MGGFKISEVFWLGYLPMLGIILVLTLTFYFRQYGNIDTLKSRSRALFRSALLLVIAPFLFLLLFVFTKSVYSSLPYWVGGGKPSNALVVVDSTLGQMLEFDRKRGAYSAVLAYVLFEDDRTLLIGYQFGYTGVSDLRFTVLRLNKADIRLIEYDGVFVIVKGEGALEPPGNPKGGKTRENNPKKLY